MLTIYKNEAIIAFVANPIFPKGKPSLRIKKILNSKKRDRISLTPKKQIKQQQKHNPIK